MKIRLLTCSAAIALLLLQSCSKKESTVLNTPNINSQKKVTSGTVAYQDNTITNWFKRNSNGLGSLAFDQGASVKLSNGKVLWLTGDVYYNDRNSDGTTPCLFNYHNSVLQQPSTTNWTQSSTVNLTYATSPQIFSGFSPNYFWPGNGIEIGTKVYTYLTSVNGTNGSLLNGQVGVFNEADNTVNYTAVTLPNLKGVNFGNGMFAVGSTVYVYGTLLMDGYGDTRVYVAKFSTSTPSSWTFWNGGTSWLSTMPDVTTTTGIVATTTSNALTVNYINGKYVMIYTQFVYQCDEGTAIYGSKSTSPTGGFSTPVTIYNIPDRLSGHTPKFYTPLIHPEFTANSEFLLTYCINGYAPCVASCISSKALPDVYRPRAVRVPYIVLGL